MKTIGEKKLDEAIRDLKIIRRRVELALLRMETQVSPEQAPVNTQRLRVTFAKVQCRNAQTEMLLHEAKSAHWPMGTAYHVHQAMLFFALDLRMLAWDLLNNGHDDLSRRTTNMVDSVMANVDGMTE